MNDWDAHATTFDEDLDCRTGSMSVLLAESGHHMGGWACPPRWFTGGTAVHRVRGADAPRRPVWGKEITDERYLLAS